MRGKLRTGLGAGGAVALAVWLAGCVTVAEFRKLEREVLRMKRSGAVAGRADERVADLGSELDGVEARLASIEGRLEVVEHRTEQALREAQAARREVGEAAARESSAVAEPAGPGSASDEQPPPEPGSADEVAAYREAYAAWRDAEPQACVDRFRDFLQTYPSSAYADDAAYWMADCYFKQGDYKTAILRFDDVVARYPQGNKAADALYRQGEVLLRLGPGYAKAASKAFERLIQQYPRSPRVAEAQRQLELLGPG